MGEGKRSIVANLSGIRKEIGDTALVAVTKYVGIKEIKELFDAGQRVFGESRVKEAIPKIGSIDAKWHMIGHLQSNKVRDAVKYFDWIDSIDSVKIAKKVSDQAIKEGKIIDIHIQVNIGMEPQKSGIPPDKVESFITQIKEYEGIKIRGLMCIAPQGKDPRSYFRQMKRLFEKIKDIDTLSMGMSGDYHEAIECGSTMVRIGTRLFS